jgi:hypothetical protein
MLLGETPDGLADSLEALAERLAAMTGHQRPGSAAGAEVAGGESFGDAQPGGEKAGSSAGASRARSRAPSKASTTVFPVTWQCAGATPSRRRFARAPAVGQEMPARQRRGHAAVHLLEERRAPREPVQETRLDVSDRDARVERGQGRPEDGRGVALDEDDIGVMAIRASRRPAVATRPVSSGNVWPGRMRSRSWSALRPKAPSALVEHLAMLRGGHQDRAKLRGVPQREVNRGQLDDDLGAGCRR